MKKDKALEELFLEHKPHFDDQAAFMSELTRRLDNVEYIRRHEEAAMRRYKIAMVAAFVVGIVSGAITTALVLSTPIDVPLFTLDVKSRLLVWICQHSRLIFATATALLMSVGLISIVSNIQDIMSMRVSMARSTKKRVG